MKNLWKILAIGAFAAMLVLPQTAAAGVKFGIKGGANIANVNGDFTETIADWKSSVGFCAGIFLELNFGRILTIQPEVLYTMKGADAGTGKLKFDYIEIPILLKIRIPTGSVHPFIFAGPAFGFNLKAVLDGIEVEDMPKGRLQRRYRRGPPAGPFDPPRRPVHDGAPEARDPRPGNDRPEERRALGDARPGLLSDAALIF